MRVKKALELFMLKKNQPNASVEITGSEKGHSMIQPLKQSLVEIAFSFILVILYHRRKVSNIDINKASLLLNISCNENLSRDNILPK